MALKTTRVQLDDLTAGMVIMTQAGRRERQRIIEIGAHQGDDTSGHRPATVEQVGGKRAGRQFRINLYATPKGWEVAVDDQPTAPAGEVRDRVALLIERHAAVPAGIAAELARILDARGLLRRDGT